jgi:hypothetical protein
MSRFLRSATPLALAAVFLAVAGCGLSRTTRTVLPQISASPRTSLQADPPLLISVFDAQTQKALDERARKAQDANTQKGESKNVVETLKAGLSETYGSSIEWTDYFAEVPDGRTAVKIRLKAIEANHGSRIVSSTSVTNSFTTARAQVSGDWTPVVATASAQQAVFGGNFSADGWWIGVSWLSLEVVDKRGSQTERFSVPLVAERKKHNMWGYESGDAAANEAWGQVEQQLIQVMDKILITVRNQEN